MVLACVALQWIVVDSPESFRPHGPVASGAPRKARGGPRSAATAREIATRRLGDQAHRFPDLLLAPLETAGLDERDAGLAHAIYDAAIRRWHTLAYVLDRVLTQPFRLMEPMLQGVLLTGAVQLLLLDRVPVHAAIDESVELAKRLVRPGAGGLTNAVLRKVAAMRVGVDDELQREQPVATIARDRLPLADGRWLRLSGPILPDSGPERLAVATGNPDWLVRRWGSKFPTATVFELSLHNLVSPPVVFNTAHARSALPTSLTPHSHAGHHVFTGGRRDLVTLLDSRPDIWVQDAASSRAVSSAAHLSPSLIVDACAGQGTKTRQLAAVFPNANIVATDTDEKRLRVLEQGFRGHARVLVVPPADLVGRFMGRADLVLLDVPCTNSGVLARRTEAKYRCDDEQLARLVALQGQIIASSLPLLNRAAKGRILYSTCSIDDEENGQQVARAISAHGLRLEHAQALLPAGIPGQDPAGYHDGSYSALLA